jgi:hypothetical protein
MRQWEDEKLTFVDDAVDYAESIHGEFNARNGAGFDGFILFVKVVVESWTVVASIALRPEIECEVGDIGI